MKVKCKYNFNCWSDLTIGKTYEVISEHDKCYYIINNKGYNSWFMKTRFKKAVAEMRNDKINKLLE